MENAITISETVGTIYDGSVEVCATADAAYDPAARRVSVLLDSFARRLSIRGDGQHLSESWLPPAERVTESLPREEASSFARDVFRNWTRKVRAAVPEELRLQT